MKIFLGSPTKTKINDWVWETTRHKGWVVVRADSEAQASGIAMLEFITQKPRKARDRLQDLAMDCFKTGKTIRIPPWEMKEFVDWIEIFDPKYSIEGEKGIIDLGKLSEKKGWTSFDRSISWLLIGATIICIIVVLIFMFNSKPLIH